MTAPEPAGPPRWRRLRAASQVVWMALVAVFTVRFALRHGHELAALDVAADPATWAVAFAWILAAKGAISLMVHQAWRAAGAHMGLGPAVYTYNLSQLPKYLPGGVWPYVSRVRMARARAVDLPRIGGGLALETAFLLGGAMVLAALTVDAGAVVGTAGAAATGVAGLERWVPALRGGVLTVLAMAWVVVYRRSVRRSSLLLATGLALVAWIFIGLSFHTVVAGLASAEPGVGVAGLFALAWGVGFVAVFSPAGIGVREVILGVGLASWGAPATVAAMVVGHRLLYVAADVVCALCARLLFPPGDRA